MAAGGRTRRHGLAQLGTRNTHAPHTHAHREGAETLRDGGTRSTNVPRRAGAGAGPGEEAAAVGAVLLPCAVVAARSRAGGEPRGGGAARARIWVARTRAPPSSRPAWHDTAPHRHARLRWGLPRRRHPGPHCPTAALFPPAAPAFTSATTCPVASSRKDPSPLDWMLCLLLPSEEANRSLSFQHRTIPPLDS